MPLAMGTAARAETLVSAAMAASIASVESVLQSCVGGGGGGGGGGGECVG